MTSGSSAPLPDPSLTAEERELALRLSTLDGAAGPSAALDARILAAAREAAAPRRAVRTRRRWPAITGAAASLVVAVGLAWQLKPLLHIPLPLPRDAVGTPETVTVEVLAEPIRRAVPPPPAPPAEEAPLPPTAPALQRRPASRPTAAAPPAPPPAPPARVEQQVADFVDEGIGVRRGRQAQATLPASPAAAAAPEEPSAPTVSAAGPGTAHSDGPPPAQSSAFGPVSADAGLRRRAWLERIRARRDAGESDLATESLRAFVAAHPRAYIPRDLRPLLRQAGE